MNELRNLLAVNQAVLASAATAYGSSFRDLAEMFRLSDLVDQLEASGTVGATLLEGGLPAYEAAQWFDEQRDLAPSEVELDGWLEFLHAPGAELGLLVPNDPFPESRLAVFTSDEAITGPVWASFATFDGRRILTSFGADTWHCVMVSGGGCAPVGCGGPCQSKTAIGIPGSRRCVCDPHGR